MPERKEFQDKFVSREIQVLCACDLLNEGRDCLEIEVLFMARPTMSKVLCTHRLFKLKEYKPGQLAVAPGVKKAAEAGSYARGEKPEALIDWPVDATDYELVDIFNWQEEAEGMISQMDMSYSYKPVLMKSILLYADERGRIHLSLAMLYPHTRSSSSRSRSDSVSHARKSGLVMVPFFVRAKYFYRPAPERFDRWL